MGETVFLYHQNLILKTHRGRKTKHKIKAQNKIQSFSQMLENGTGIFF
jgi:hypothetical protein